MLLFFPKLYDATQEELLWEFSTLDMALFSRSFAQFNNDLLHLRCDLVNFINRKKVHTFQWLDLIYVIMVNIVGTPAAVVHYIKLNWISQSLLIILLSAHVRYPMEKKQIVWHQTHQLPVYYKVYHFPVITTYWMSFNQCMQSQIQENVDELSWNSAVKMMEHSAVIDVSCGFLRQFHMKIDSHSLRSSGCSSAKRTKKKYYVFRSAPCVADGNRLCALTMCMLVSQWQMFNRPLWHVCRSIYRAQPSESIIGLYDEISSTISILKSSLKCHMDLYNVHYDEHCAKWPTKYALTQLSIMSLERTKSKVPSVNCGRPTTGCVCACVWQQVER